MNIITPQKLYKETEAYIYKFHQMQADVREWEEQCAYTERPINGIKGSFVPDPTYKGAEKLSDAPEHIQKARAWIDVITTAWADMQAHDPELARIFETFYGLGVRHGEKEGITIKLSRELHMSQRNIYRRRALCVQWVRDIALYRRLLEI